MKGLEAGESGAEAMGPGLVTGRESRSELIENAEELLLEWWATARTRRGPASKNWAWEWGHSVDVLLFRAWKPQN